MYIELACMCHCVYVCTVCVCVWGGGGALIHVPSTYVSLSKCTPFEVLYNRVAEDQPGLPGRPARPDFQFGLAGRTPGIRLQGMGSLGCHTTHAYGVSLSKGNLRFRCKIRLKLSFSLRAKAIKEKIALTAWLEQLLFVVSL